MSQPISDPIGLIIDVTSLVIVIMMAVYGARLLVFMRTGVLERSWRYMSVGSVMIALGILAIAYVSINSYIPQLIDLFHLGGLAMIAGGVLFVMGFRLQYNAFKLKFAYTKPHEKIGDLS